MNRQAGVSSIPALRDDSKSWVLDADGKATLFASNFASKCCLGALVESSYSRLGVHDFPALPPFGAIRLEATLKLFDTFKVEFGTWPDLLPVRILIFLQRPYQTQ